MDKTVCSECGKAFNSEEALNQHMYAKHSEKIKQPILSSGQKRKIKSWSILIVIAVTLIGGIYFLVSSAKTLPPIDARGHVEANPSSHILKEPMPTAVQKHMLEHADGSGPPGVVVNYNCDDYACGNELIEKLEAFAGKYDHVYVAPFPDMDAKIALTRYGKIDTMDDYNEERIERFISG